MTIGGEHTRDIYAASTRETDLVVIRVRATRLALEQAIDDFIQKNNRFPDWSKVEILVEHTDREVKVAIDERV